MLPFLHLHCIILLSPKKWKTVTILHSGHLRGALCPSCHDAKTGKKAPSERQMWRKLAGSAWVRDVLLAEGSKLQVPSTDTSRQLKEVSQAVLDLQPYRRNSSARNADGRMRLVDIFQGITLISDASSCSTAAATPAGSSTSADTTLVLDDFDPKMSRVLSPTQHTVEYGLVTMYCPCSQEHPHSTSTALPRPLPNSLALGPSSNSKNHA